jgi:hypothetical protein
MLPTTNFEAAGRRFDSCQARHLRSASRRKRAAIALYLNSCGYSLYWQAPLGWCATISDPSRPMET